MAFKALTEDDLTCPVCIDIFNNPVLLSCSHSVCKACLQQYWNLKKSNECPLCREKVLSNTTSNLALKNLCETFLQETTEVHTKDETVCSLHNEKLKLFCLEHQEPVCVVCRDSKTHNKHRFCPLSEAALEYREKLETALGPLQDKLKIFQDFKLSLDQTAEHIKTQAQHTERLIKEQFVKLHQFLHDEEAVKIITLREEEEQKSKVIKEKIEKMSREISSLTDTIRAVENKMRADDVLFLQNYAATMKKTQLTLQNPEKPSGVLINAAKYLSNIKFRVWERMQEIIYYTPVTLDPNTAHSKLILFDDLTSVRYSYEKQPLPDNPERFDKNACVLGSEGFDSGTHCWDVEVGDSTGWFVGVMTESAQRNINLYSSPGAWFVWYFNSEYGAYSPSRSSASLSLKTKLHSIRVQLDYNKRKLLFSDPHTRTHIQNFTFRCTERVFPLFSVSGNVSALKILTTKGS